MVDILKKPESNNNSNKIFTKTWIKDSHGLYDYESHSISQNTITPSNNTYLYRVNDEVVISQTIMNEPENQFLAKISIDPKNNNNVTLSTNVPKELPINNETVTALQDQIWQVVKANSITANSKPNRYHSNYIYELKKNDILKLGRVKFVVKDINIAGKKLEESEETFLPYEPATTNHKIAEGEVCRICYMAEATDDNPMIAICKCKGTMNLHFNCLQMWLKSKLTVKEINDKPGVSYIVKQFNCEICYDPYPVTIKNKDKLFNLINYEVPEGQNYVVLQSLNSVKENLYPLAVHVLMFIDEGQSFTLGRGHESDIKISDISVSRLHARIFMKDDKFYMEDMCSKFGTLVLTKKPVALEPNSLLQIGRTLVLYKEDYKLEHKMKEKIDDWKMEIDDMKMEGDDKADGDNGDVDDLNNLHI